MSVAVAYQFVRNCTMATNMFVQRKDFIGSFLYVPCIVNQLSRGIKKFSRKPVKIIRHDPESKGKSFEEYAKDEKLKSAVFEQDHIKSQNYNGMPMEVFNEGEIPNPEEISKYKKTTDIFNRNNSTNDESYKSLKFLNFQLYNKCHRKVKQYLEYGKSPKLRYANDIYLVEGWRLLAEALIAGLKPEAIFYSRSRLLAQMAPMLTMKERELSEFLNLFPVIKTPYQTLQTWSALANSPGVTAAFKLSEAVYLCQEKKSGHLPIIVVLDEIRDPNNLGSIIRSMVAAGPEKIILTKGCCDMWDSKVLRAACGGHFRACIKTSMQWSQIREALPAHSCIYVADAKAEVLDNEVNYSDIGLKNEEQMDLLTLKDISIDLSKKQTVYEVDESNNKLILNESYNDIDHLSLFSNIQMPTENYHSINYFSSLNDNTIVLIIGGETGLSNAAKKFVIENDGTQVFIPMNNGVQSLNNAVTTSILVYEISRQYNQILNEQNKLKL